METVEKELTKVIIERSESDTTQKETLATLESSVKKALENIRQMESKLADVSDVMQVIDSEKIPAIQAQIKDVRTEVERASTEISGIRESISSLEKEDEKLWKELAAVEKNLDKAVDKNLKEIDKQLEKTAANLNQLEKDMKDAIKQMEEKMDSISRGALSYRYEQGSNTLYLMPSSGEVKP